MSELVSDVVSSSTCQMSQYIYLNRPNANHQPPLIKANWWMKESSKAPFRQLTVKNESQGGVVKTIWEVHHTRWACINNLQRPPCCLPIILYTSIRIIIRLETPQLCDRLIVRGKPNSWQTNNYFYLCKYLSKFAFNLTWNIRNYWTQKADV